MGPEGGSRGGLVVAEGTPEAVAGNAASYTGQFLKPILQGREATQPKPARRASATRAPAKKAAARTTKKAAAPKAAGKKTAKKATTRRSA
jgi:excinuclease ABC subunit A